MLAFVLCLSFLALASEANKEFSDEYAACYDNIICNYVPNGRNDMFAQCYGKQSPEVNAAQMQVVSQACKDAGVPDATEGTNGDRNAMLDKFCITHETYGWGKQMEVKKSFLKGIQNVDKKCPSKFCDDYNEALDCQFGFAQNYLDGGKCKGVNPELEG